MQSYNDYLMKVTHSEPYVRVLIGGIDVSSRLVRDKGIETDSLLDTPELGVYTSSDVYVFLTNHDNYFSAKEEPNFFTENSFDASGWRVPVVIQGGFVGLDPRIIFYGEIEEIKQLATVRQVRVLVLDPSTRLRRAWVDNIGEEVTRDLIGGGRDNPNYTEVNPVYQLGPGDLPVSRESLSARIGGEQLRVHPSLPQGGAGGDYRDIAVNLNDGTLTFGSEPPDKSTTLLSLSFKTAYRYRTPEFLVYILAKAQGIYEGMDETELGFAMSLLESPTMTHQRNQVSSRGRPKSLTAKPIIRGIVSDLDGVYLCGDRSLLQYSRRSPTELDRYTLLGLCPDTDAVLLDIVQNGDDFYILSSATRTGLSSKIWRFRGTTWTELAAEGNGDPSTAFPYDYATDRDLVSDNRKGFVIQGGYLYFIFTDTGHGVRRINLSSGAIENVYVVPQAARHSADFIFHFNTLYVFFCEQGTGTNNSLKVYRMNSDGSSATEIFSEQFDRNEGFYPASVSDIEILDNHFYFVISLHRRVIRSGVAELSRLPLAGGTRGVLKKYDNMLFAARSLKEYKGRVYFVEGQWISSFSDREFPTFSDAGHLGSIDRHGMLVDEGGAWRSYVDRRGGTGFGVHTAFSSKIWHDNLTDSLFFIGGYGLPIDVDSESVATADDPVAGDLTNWVWLQYGRNLATRFAELRSNGMNTWDLLSSIARSVDWEIGFTEAVSELESFYASNPTVERFTPRHYLFFRPKTPRSSDLVLDGSVNVGIENALDTTLILNHIVVSYGDGFVPARDEALIAKHGSRAYPVITGLLAAHDGAWAEILAKRILRKQRVPRHKFSSVLKFAPHLVTGQYVEVTSRWNSFVNVPFQLTQVEQFSELWQTRIEGREITEAITELSFEEAVPDFVGIVGQNVSETLPQATGGVSPLMYAMEGLAPGLTFNTSPLGYAGRLTEAGTFLAKYTVRDSAPLPDDEEQIFKMVVKGPDGTVTPEPETGEATPIWRGFDFQGSKAWVLSDVENKVFLYEYPDMLESEHAIGNGTWRDIAVDGTILYLLDTSGTPKVKSISVAGTLGDTLTPTDFISLPSDTGNEWFGLDVLGGKVYVLGKISDNMEEPNPDYKVCVWSGSSRSVADDIDMMLDGNYSGVVVKSPNLNVLIEDMGVVLGYDLAGKTLIPGSISRSILPGTTGWVGLAYSEVSGREGFYALRGNGSRLLAFTDSGSRNSSHDYRL